MSKENFKEVSKMDYKKQELTEEEKIWYAMRVEDQSKIVFIDGKEVRIP